MKNSFKPSDFNLKAKDVFHSSGASWPAAYKDAVILFDNAFISGVITSEQILQHPLVTVNGIKSENKLFGYSIRPHASLKYCSCGGTLFVASSVENVEVPKKIIEVFSGKNFSIYIDDFEQAVVSISNVPKIVDVSGASR
jgi:hypothetical protein